MLLIITFQLNSFLQGYSVRGSDHHLPIKFFERVRDNTLARKLHPAEWQLVQRVADRILLVSTCTTILF